MTKYLTLSILFSTEVNALVVYKLLKLGILYLTSFILAFRAVVVAKLVTSGNLSSIFLILSLYTSFSTNFLSTKSLDVFKSIGKGFNYQHLIQLIYQYRIYQPLNLKVDKSCFLANCDIFTPAALFKSDFFSQLHKSNSISIYL